MSKSVFIAVAVALALAGLLFAGCGGSNKADDVVAQVGNEVITESTLDHWMATFVRGDFYQTVGRRAPDGLATDPPSYGLCVNAARTLAPGSAAGQKTLTKAQLQQKCRFLYDDVRQEALSYLISAVWAAGQAGELGKHVSDQEVQENLNHLITQQYKTKQAFAAYLGNKGWSIADMHYILKRNLHSEVVTADAQRKASALGGGEQAFVHVIGQRNRKWSAKTNCRAGYVVWQCKEYKPQSTQTPSPAVIFEEMGAH